MLYVGHNVLYAPCLDTDLQVLCHSLPTYVNLHLLLLLYQIIVPGILLLISTCLFNMLYVTKQAGQT